MAFGFLKKIVTALTGGKSQKNGAGRGGNKGRGGNNKDRSKQSRQGQPRKDRGQDGRSRNGGGRNNGSSARPQNGNGQQAKGQFHRDQPPRTGGQQGGRGDRRDNRGNRRPRRNGPAPVNTAAGQMRPGGEISEAELAARRAAHAAWNPETFVVEPMEGKRRFHDFDLPSEVMHGIADLGFKYCTEIQALSLEQALAGKNIAGKAQTGSGKTAAFLVAILTRYLRTPERMRLANTAIYGVWPFMGAWTTIGRSGRSWMLLWICSWRPRDGSSISSSPE